MKRKENIIIIIIIIEEEEGESRMKNQASRGENLWEKMWEPNGESMGWAKWIILLLYLIYYSWSQLPDESAMPWQDGDGDGDYEMVK